MTEAQYNFLKDISSNDMLTVICTRITELEDKVRRQAYLIRGSYARR